MAVAGPQVEFAGDELTALVNPDRGWIANLGTDLFQHIVHIEARKRNRRTTVGENRLNVSTTVRMRSFGPLRPRFLMIIVGDRVLITPLVGSYMANRHAPPTIAGGRVPRDNHEVKQTRGQAVVLKNFRIAKSA